MIKAIKLFFLKRKLNRIYVRMHYLNGFMGAFDSLKKKPFCNSEEKYLGCGGEYSVLSMESECIEEEIEALEKNK